MKIVLTCFTSRRGRLRLSDKYISNIVRRTMSF